MILRCNSLEILWHTFEVYFIFPHEKFFKSMCKIEKIFIQLTCFCPFLTLILFSVMSILLQGPVFRFEIILTFAGGIIAQSNAVHECSSTRSCLQHSFYEHISALTFFTHQSTYFVFWNGAHSKKFLTSFPTKVKKK